MYDNVDIDLEVSNLLAWLMDLGVNSEDAQERADQHREFLNEMHDKYFNKPKGLIVGE